VTLLTWDEGQASELEIDGVLVMRMCRRDAGFPWVRFLHPRWTSLSRAMRRANAEVYYQNCGDYVTGQVAVWCRLHRKPFVYTVASDPDCDPSLPKLPTVRERLLYSFGVKNANRIIVQTVRQRDMLRAGFARDARVIPMPCAAPPIDAPRSHPSSRPQRVVWIGRFSHVKRLEVMLEVAALLPEIHFEIAGSPEGAGDYSRSLFARAGMLPNVSLCGLIPRYKMPAFYEGALALLCTSAYEGFPNTFLEAWSLGVPVVSTVEPDRLLSEGGLGSTGSTPEELAKAILRFAASAKSWEETSNRCRKYFRDYHTIESSMPQFEQLLESAAATVRSPQLAFS
jgi:glycosyltransferase involved in cell wall biosynthesis